MTQAQVAIESAINKANKVKSFQKLKLGNHVNSNWSVDDILAEFFRYPTSTMHEKYNRPQKTGALRSITDAYRVVSFYHPDIKICEVIEHIVSLRFRNRSGNEVKMTPSFCWVVRKCVFGQTTHSQATGVKTEFGGLNLEEVSNLFKENDI